MVIMYVRLLSLQGRENKCKFRWTRNMSCLGLQEEDLNNLRLCICSGCSRSPTARRLTPAIGGHNLRMCSLTHQIRRRARKLSLSSNCRKYVQQPLVPVGQVLIPERKPFARRTKRAEWLMGTKDVVSLSRPHSLDRGRRFLRGKHGGRSWRNGAWLCEQSQLEGL